jgi:hypothetical protein
LVVVLVMCGVQYYLLARADYSRPPLDVALQTVLPFLLPTVVLLIIRIKMGKEAAVFCSIPLWVISIASICAVVFSKYLSMDDTTGLLFTSFVKLSVIYAVIGFIPTLIMTSVSSAKEKERDKLEQKTNY